MVEARPKATAASSVTKSPAATSTALKKTGAAVISSTAKVTPGASKPAAPKGAAAAAVPKGAAAATPAHTHISSRVKGAQRDNYECPVCLELCAQPILTPCKHFMCFQCNKRVVAAGMTCPMCRAHFDKLFVPQIDTQLQRQIAAAMGSEYEERK